MCLEQMHPSQLQRTAQVRMRAEQSGMRMDPSQLTRTKAYRQGGIRMIGNVLTGQKLSDLQRIAFRIRSMAEGMKEEGLMGYALTLEQYADWIEKVIW